jgi:hypothetical protein
MSRYFISIFLLVAIRQHIVTDLLSGIFSAGTRVLMSITCTVFYLKLDENKLHMSLFIPI